jgi:pyruvate,water dikinase
VSEVKVAVLDFSGRMDAGGIGGKAVSLVRLREMGVAVPPGFCVTTDTYREHLEKNNLAVYIEGVLEQLKVASAEVVRSLLADIRDAIFSAAMAEELRGEIENHYRALGAGRVAVRSSASAEDLPGHSFAGQYDTYLKIADVEGCIEAVKKCWGSVWTERAYNYREKNGFDHVKVNMAVIVQSLIEADASGVLFTADPVTGRSDRAIIEACRGLGDMLVSGKVTPDGFVVDKDKLKVVTRQVAQECIDESIARRLTETGKKVEAEFGRPQDIEWVVHSNEIFFLQSRAITTKAPLKSWEERQVWTNANTGEVIPDVVTPFAWSVIQSLLDEAFDHLLGLVGIERSENLLFGVVAGRIYFNVNTLIAAAKQFPGGQLWDLNKLFGGEQGKMYGLGQIDIREEDVPRLRFSLGKFLVNMPGLVIRIVTYRPRKGERMIAELAGKIYELQRLDVSGMSDEEIAKRLVEQIQDLRGHLADVRHGALYAMVGMGALQMLDKVCRKWFGEEGVTLANRLLAGVGDMDSAQAGHELWRLGLKAHEVGEVEQVILAGDDWEETREKIGEVEKGVEFLRSWDKFMRRHGHHCRGEIEPYNARWCETPDYVLGLVRSYIGCIGETDPIEEYERRAAQRHQFEEQCRQRLKNPVKRWKFNYLLNHAQRGCVIRENSKSHLARIVAKWRRMLVELGGRLSSNGVLENPDDIFFLRYDEVEPVTGGRANFDVKEVICGRRAEYERWKTVTPPKVVVGSFDAESIVPEPAVAGAEVLTGVAVSCGVVTGKARVILRADTDKQVLPGEILVAPFTDPGWTPYFVPAAGIVMDMGGLLSHGSIIAREYGIPAVVNVGPGTKIIKTGQSIQVDGNRGVVRILDNQ